MCSYVALLILAGCSSSASPQWQSALHVPVAAAVVPPRTCVSSKPKGVTIKGHVVDDAGDPVAGARVTVLQSSMQQQSTTTSKDGAFVFCDLVPLPLESHDLILMAEARNGWRSRSQIMRLENATIQLTLGRTGAVEFGVSGAVREHSIVIGVGSDGEMFRAAVAANGIARAEHVLPGTYALTLRFTPLPGHPPTLGSVTVRPDRVASASLVAQPPNIDIEVRLGSACSTVELRRSPVDQSRLCHAGTASWSSMTNQPAATISASLDNVGASRCPRLTTFSNFPDGAVGARPRAQVQAT